MSSLKKPTDEVANEEPGSKRVKISEPDSKTSDAETSKSNGADNAKSGSNNHASNKTPLKTVANGASDKKPDDGQLGHSDEDDDDEEEEAGQFDPKIANCLEQVEGIQSEICNLNEKASEEILKVEQKYNKLRRPYFEKRNELLKEIANFWLTSMANHPKIGPMIESAEEEDCLHYLINLDVEEFEDIKSGYELKFQFDENPYITNKSIVKQFHISSEEVESQISPPIDYKDTPKGQRLKQIVQECVGQPRRSRREGQPQSFFAWLSENTPSGTDEIAETIKDQIWPNPLEYFFAPPDEYGDGSDDESDDEEDDIDGDDLDGEELDDDDEAPEISGLDGGFSGEDEDIEDIDDDEEDIDDEEPDD